MLRLETKRPAAMGWRWAMGAAAVLAVAVVGLAFNNGMLPGQHPVRAAVQTVDGSLYTGSGEEMRAIPVGYEIRNGDEVRTAKGSRAVVRLLDGSQVEMGERSNLSVSREWRGTTIHLDGGQVIVQAAKQQSGHRLYVATDDGLVSVKGTIFSVNRGTKGSRVAVIEGVVRVNFGEETTDLHAGEQATSGSTVSKVPIQNEIAWSRNSAKYLALLGRLCCPAESSLQRFRGRDCVTAPNCCRTFPITPWFMRRFRISRTLWQKPTGSSGTDCSRVRHCVTGGSSSKKETDRSWKMC